MVSLGDYFYPRPPRGGRRTGQCRHLFTHQISIHALREEGDPVDLDVTTVNYPFLSTPSARRATLLLPLTAARSSIFLSTPSARRATHPALRRHRILRISIHALREEGDSTVQGVQRTGNHFYPRPPRGGRRVARGKSRPASPISIHALREEGDQAAGPAAGRWAKISIHALREEGDR